MIGIYKITNKLTGKSYVGQSIHCGERFDQHCGGNSQLIDKAIKENGIENFTFEILKTIDNEDELNYWEDYYIIEYNTMFPNGYNKRWNTSYHERIGMEIQDKSMEVSQVEENNIQLYEEAWLILEKYPQLIFLFLSELNDIFWWGMHYEDYPEFERQNYCFDFLKQHFTIECLNTPEVVEFIQNIKFWVENVNQKEMKADKIIQFSRSRYTKLQKDYIDLLNQAIDQYNKISPPLSFNNSEWIILHTDKIALYWRVYYGSIVFVDIRCSDYIVSFQRTIQKLHKNHEEMFLDNFYIAPGIHILTAPLVKVTSLSQQEIADFVKSRFGSKGYMIMI